MGHIAITDHNFPTVESRLEAFRSFQDRLPKFLKRGVYRHEKSLGNVCTVRSRYLGDKSGWKKQWFWADNIATDAADLFYAQKAVGASLTNDFASASNRMELGNPGINDTIAKDDTYGDLGSPITASRKSLTAGYPKAPDTDTDNTGLGADIATWGYSWTVGDFNTLAANDIRCGVIHLGAGSPSGSTVILSHWNYATPFEKTDSDTLKSWINHRFNGT